MSTLSSRPAMNSRDARVSPRRFMDASEPLALRPVLRPPPPGHGGAADPARVALYVGAQTREGALIDARFKGENAIAILSGLAGSPKDACDFARPPP